LLEPVHARDLMRIAELVARYGDLPVRTAPLTGHADTLPPWNQAPGAPSWSSVTAT
jgi:hypothetical protein